MMSAYAEESLKTYQRRTSGLFLKKAGVILVTLNMGLKPLTTALKESGLLLKNLKKQLKTNVFY